MLRDETIRRVIQFRDDREWRQFHTPKDLAISLSLEAAELLEIFQWSGADLECRDKLGRIREELAARGGFSASTAFLRNAQISSPNFGRHYGKCNFSSHI